MKRSEFAAKLREALLGQVVRDDFEYQILDIIEELGMEPPGEFGFDGVTTYSGWEAEENAQT